jgi:hypothetical protein
MITTQQVTAWMDAYVYAWTTGARDDIEALFTRHAEYHELPYETSWVGRDRILAGWRSRQKWQEGGWTFDWKILMVTGNVAAVQGRGVYKELETFDNLWVVTVDTDGRCSAFRMWNTEV